MIYDLIVIGGGPAGIISALSAKKNYPDKTVLLIKDIEDSVIPCGIPYMFYTLKSEEDNALGTSMLKSNNIDVVIMHVDSVDTKNKLIIGKQNYNYDKLIIATGSHAVKPPIKGIDKKRIYPIVKSMSYLKNLKKDLENSKNIVIVGGGFIGVEFADELAKSGKNITIVELMPRILDLAFDDEFIDLAEQELKSKNIKIITGKKVVEFLGDEFVSGIVLDDSTKLDADLVILGIGAAPNSDIVNDTGIELGKHKEILVNEFMQTSDKDVFAVGDCASKKDHFTNKSVGIMLASTATAEARIAGSSLWGVKNVKSFNGTIPTYITKLGNLVIGAAGLIEKHAKGFSVKIGRAEVPDKHPSKMPNCNTVKIKLIFDSTNTIIGGEIAGKDIDSELLNIIAVAIQSKMRSYDLRLLQLATQPRLNSPPTSYPIVVASENLVE